MYSVICLVAAVIPALLLVVYYYRQDRGKPEPKSLLLRTFIGGIIIIVPVIVIELVFENIFAAVLGMSPAPAVVNGIIQAGLKAFIVAGFCEELFKLLLIRGFAYRNEHFDEVMDGIVYTVIGSLGFACFENVLYVMQNGLTVAVVRAVATVPMHAMAAGIMGYYIGKARFAPAEQRMGLFVKGLAQAVVLHGLFDFAIFLVPVVGALPLLVLVPLLIYMFSDLRKKIRAAIDDDIQHGRVAPLAGFAPPPGYGPAAGPVPLPGYAPPPGFGYYPPGVAGSSQMGGPPPGGSPPGGFSAPQ